MSQIQIPKGWDIKKLSETCKMITSGGTPSRGNSSFFGGDIPWLKIGDLNEGVIYNSEEKISKEGLDNSSAKLFPKNTVLLAMYGATIGKTGILGIECTTNQAICGMICGKDLDPNYLLYFLKSKYHEIRKKAEGGAQPNINQNKIKNLEIPLAPKETQKKIVQKLDYILGKLEEKKKEILKLSEQNRDSIKFLKENLILFSISKLIPKDHLKNGWTMKKLSEVCEVERGKFGHRPRNDPDFYGGKYPFIQTGDIARANGRVRTFSQTLNEKGFKVSRMFPKGTVVITIAANIGDTAILEFDSCFPDSIIGITPMNDKAIPEYIEYVLRLYQNALNRDASKGAQKNINYGFLKPLKIPVPPNITSQRDIVRQIQKAETELVSTLIRFNEFEEKQKKLVKYLTALVNSILNKAFSGKLVN